MMIGSTAMIQHDHLTQMVGFLAAASTVGAFSFRDILRLRIAALMANLLFISYGAMLMLVPVLALHLILLPLNIARLVAFRQDRRKLAGHHLSPLLHKMGSPS